MSTVVVGSPTLALSEDIGESLRALRQARGLSQKELSRRLGIARAQLSQVESGSYTPSLRVLETILAELDARLVIELEEGGSFRDQGGGS